MKPVFCNTFNVTHNKAKSEIALTFSHVYTEHQFAMKDGALTDVSGQVCDNVASILVNRDGAVALAKLLYRMCSDWGIDLEESR
ncbi:MAG: hypothetical protein IKS27_07905 [Oscillospiraceae bacterium]|jgi:hypothetical protein|nr:hypothetical protein [Oscillospiraceae bacterium]MBQ8930602.1 hypothetical protein [Oscillospiraceae bacterium]MBR6431123.1 hypothetical protein [Oscillospiraceae bacterium]